MPSGNMKISGRREPSQFYYVMLTNKMHFSN